MLYLSEQLIHPVPEKFSRQESDNFSYKEASILDSPFKIKHLEKESITKIKMLEVKGASIVELDPEEGISVKKYIVIW